LSPLTSLLAVNKPAVILLKNEERERLDQAQESLLWGKVRVNRRDDRVVPQFAANHFVAAKVLRQTRGSPRGREVKRGLGHMHPSQNCKPFIIINIVGQPKFAWCATRG
jgi:hypothetical protein